MLEESYHIPFKQLFVQVDTSDEINIFSSGILVHRRMSLFHAILCLFVKRGLAGNAWAMHSNMLDMSLYLAGYAAATTTTVAAATTTGLGGTCNRGS